MSDESASIFNALNLGDDTLYAALLDYSKQAANTATTVSQQVSGVLPAAGAAMYSLSLAPTSLSSRLALLQSQRYNEYLGPVACHERRIAHLAILRRNDSPEDARTAQETTEAFIRQHYPFQKATEHVKFREVLDMLGSTRHIERQYGTNGYRREYFHYPETGPVRLGERLLDVVKVQGVETPISLEGGCPQGNWLETVSPYRSNRGIGARATLLVHLPRPHSSSSTTFEISYDYDGSNVEISSSNWSIYNRVFVTNGMEGITHEGGIGNIDFTAARDVLKHYMGTVAPQVSCKSLAAMTMDQSPYREASFTIPVEAAVFFVDDTAHRFPYQNEHFRPVKILYNPKTPHPFVKVIETFTHSEVGGMRRCVTLKVDDWMMLRWDEENGCSLTAVLERPSSSDPAPEYFGTEEGISVIQAAIDGAMTAYIESLKEHAELFQQLARLDSMTYDERRELSQLLNTTPFVPLGSYGDSSYWRLEKAYSDD